jgi:peptide chain release factor 1
MFEKLESVARRSEELMKLLSDPAVFADPETLRRYAKEQADLRPVMSVYHEYRKLQQELQENQELLDSEARTASLPP